MADKQQRFDLEKLKTDPYLWMRLSMPVGKRKNLGNVFSTKENPFEKDSAAAMRMIQQLAAEGKLYLREEGRSKHFRRVEPDGNELKLGESFQANADRNSDPVYGILMRASRAYFKWIGLESISNWFDKRAKNYEAVQEREQQYKEEYKALSPEKKAELKKLRKQEKREEKARKKLEKLEKETEKARQELNRVLDKDKPSKGEMENLMSNPPKVDAEKSSMQPRRLGDEPENERKNEPIKAKQATQTEQEEPKKEEKASDVRLTVGGREYTKENIAQAPENVRRAFELIEALAAQLTNIEQAQNIEPTVQAPAAQDNGINAQPVTMNDGGVQTEEEPAENKEQLPFEEVPEEDDITVEDVKTEDRQIEDIDAEKINLEDIRFAEPAENKEQLPFEEVPEDDDITVEDVKTEDRQIEGIDAEKINLEDIRFGGMAAEENAPTADQKIPDTEIPAPLTNPPDLEKGKVSAHGRAPEEGTLAERLAAEKEGMESVRNWKERIAKALLSHKEAEDMKLIYESLEDPQEGANYLTTSAMAVMALFADQPEMIDKIINGEPLGSAYDAHIHSGVEVAAELRLQEVEGDSEGLENMIANSVRQLSTLASKEGQLSERHMMIGRMISNAMSLATERGLTIPLDEREKAMAEGAVTLSRVAKSYLEARQYLGQAPLDMTSEKGVAAVRDLLMGNAVNTMIKQDQATNGESTAQILMGKDVWSEENLAQMTNNSKVRRAIRPEQVEKILNNPDSPLAHKAAGSVLNEVIVRSEELYKAQQNPERAAMREIEQPMVNPMQS